MHVDDEYARKFMAGEGEVLYFDKKTSPPWFRAMMFLLSTGGFGAFAVAFAATGNPVFALVGAPAFAFGAAANLMLWTLRTAVTERFVHVQYGLFGPKIPVEAIVSVDVVEYAWTQYGGFGVRRGRDGSTMYNMLGDQGRAVKIVYVEKGKQRTVLMSAGDPATLRDAIEAARKGTSMRTLDDARADVGLAAAPSSDALVDVEANVDVDVVAKR